jgi:hypothetical protein
MLHRRLPAHSCIRRKVSPISLYNWSNLPLMSSSLWVLGDSNFICDSLKMTSAAESRIYRVTDISMSSELGPPAKALPTLEYVVSLDSTTRWACS